LGGSLPVRTVNADCDRWFLPLCKNAASSPSRPRNGCCRRWLSLKRAAPRHALNVLKPEYQQPHINDPIVSLITIRQFGEALAQLVAARSGLFSDADEPQADLLRRLRVDGNYPPNVLDASSQSMLRSSMISESGGAAPWCLPARWPESRAGVPELRRNGRYVGASLGCEALRRVLWGVRWPHCLDAAAAVARVAGSPRRKPASDRAPEADRDARARPPVGARAWPDGGARAPAITCVRGVWAS
jgi:hypothetical protein